MLDNIEEIKKAIFELENKLDTLKKADIDAKIVQQHGLCNIHCMNTDCPNNSGQSNGFYCNAKAICIDNNGVCCTKAGEFPVDYVVAKERKAPLYERGSWGMLADLAYGKKEEEKQ